MQCRKTCFVQKELISQILEILQILQIISKGRKTKEPDRILNIATGETSQVITSLTIMTFTRVTSVKSLKGILTHQSHISQVFRKASSLTRITSVKNEWEKHSTLASAQPRYLQHRPQELLVKNEKRKNVIQCSPRTLCEGPEAQKSESISDQPTYWPG